MLTIQAHPVPGAAALITAIFRRLAPARQPRRAKALCTARRPRRGGPCRRQVQLAVVELVLGEMCGWPLSDHFFLPDQPRLVGFLPDQPRLVVFLPDQPCLVIFLPDQPCLVATSTSVQ
jgi:hypothetical protein